MRHKLLFLLFSFYAISSIAQEEDLILKYQDQLTNYYSDNPFERIFISTDKEVYKPGELVWFNAFFNNINYPGLSSVNSEFYLEIYEEAGSKLFGKTFPVKEGTSNGNILIPEGIADGKYFLVASTNYMTKSNEVFTKLIFIDPMSEDEITVEEINIPDFLVAGESNTLNFSFKELNGDPYKKKIEYELIENDKIIIDGKEKSKDGLININLDIPDKTYKAPLTLKLHDSNHKIYEHTFSIDKEELQVEFYAEGGNFVAGSPLKVGFLVTNALGQPINIESNILDGNSTTAQANTLIPGYGIFNIMADAETNYQLEITSDIGKGQVFDLPEFSSDGFLFSIQRTDDEFINANLVFTDGQAHEINLMATRGSQLFWGAPLTVNGAMRIKIPKETFTQGLSLISIFDSNGELLSDRLIYVDKKEKMNLNLEIDKNQVTGGQPFTATIKPTYNDQETVSGILSLSVSSSQRKVEQADNFVSSFEFNSMLENPIFDASSIYNEDGTISESSFNYLLISNTFKNFSWKSILGNTPNTNKSSIADYVKTISYLNANVQKPQTPIEFYSNNTNLFSDVEYSSNDRMGENKYVEALHSGTSILNVLKMMKSYRLDGDQIVFGNIVNSFYGQEGALIIIDGIKMGTSSSILENIPPTDIQAISVSTDPNEIMQYTSMNSIGVIVISTKTGNSEVEQAKEAEVIKDYNSFAEYMLDDGIDGQTTLFWEPSLKIDENGSAGTEILTNQVSGTYDIDVEFIDNQGHIEKVTKTITVD